MLVPRHGTKDGGVVGPGSTTWWCGGKKGGWSWAQGLRCLGRGTCLCVGAWLEQSIRVHTWHRLKLNVCVVYVFVTTVMFVRFSYGAYFAWNARFPRDPRADVINNSGERGFVLCGQLLISCFPNFIFSFGTTSCTLHGQRGFSLVKKYFDFIFYLGEEK